jgi:SOS-response transcriptional repressor LexA
MKDNELLDAWMLWKAQQLGREYRAYELAAESGLSEQYISHIRTGRRGIGKITRGKLSVVFGVTPSLFLNGPPPMAGQHVDRNPEATYLGEIDLTDTVPLLTSIPAGSWKSWIDTYEAGQGEERVPRYGVKGEHVFALRVEGDSMVPDLLPGDVLLINPERAFSNFHGGIGIVKIDGDYKIRNVWKRGDNYLLEPSNKAYESEVIPVTGTIIYKIETQIRAKSSRF